MLFIGHGVTFYKKVTHSRIKLIFIEQIPRNRFIGQIDPRVKIILLILFVAVLLSTSVVQPFRIITLVSILLFIILSANLPITKIIMLTVKIYPMILFISLFQIFAAFLSDKIYSDSGLLGVSNETIIRVVEFQFHSICIVIGTLIFITSTPFMHALKSLEKMKLPSWIITVIFFVYRFLFILTQELNRLFIAYRSRQFRLSLIKKVIILSKISTVILTRIFERNERLYLALVSRGFSGTLSLNSPLAWHQSDTLLLLGGSILLASITIIF